MTDLPVQAISLPASLRIPTGHKGPIESGKFTL